MKIRRGEADRFGAWKSDAGQKRQFEGGEEMTRNERMQSFYFRIVCSSKSDIDATNKILNFQNIENFSSDLHIFLCLWKFSIFYALNFIKLKNVLLISSIFTTILNLA